MNWSAVNDSKTITANASQSFSLTLEILSNKQLLIYLPSIIYTCILLVIGIPGNATVFYIYFTRWKRSSTRVFIIALAIFDLVNCLLTFPFELATMLNPFTYDNGIACKVFRFATYTCNAGGALLLIAIAIDRYQRICKPLDKPMDPRTAKLASIVILVTSVITCCPSLIIYGTQTRNITPSIQLKFCLIEDQYSTTEYPLAYLLVQCGCTVVIFTVLIVIYSTIGTQVCRRWKFRTTSIKSIGDGEDGVVHEESHCEDGKYEDSVWKDDEKSSDVSKVARKPMLGAVRLTFMSTSSTLLKAKKKALDIRTIRIGKTTIMLFVVTVAYILCFSPFLGLASHRSVYPERWKNLSQGGETAYHFFLRSYPANCAINPIIYSFFNGIFREECVKFYRKLLFKKRRLCCK